MRKRIYEIIEPAKAGDKISFVFDVSILLLIALNVTCIILESVRSIREQWGEFFYWFEIVSVAIFSGEYLLRLWSCVEGRDNGTPLLTRLGFAFSMLGLIDLFAVLPFYLPFLGVDLRFIRVVRLFRLFRVAKIGRYSKAVQLLRRVCWSKRAELVTTLFVLGLLLILASTVIYYAENEAQPEVFSSIPASMWWAVATLTTVGYGDVYPITVVGKLMAAMIAILGIGMFALPTGILGAGFVEEIQAGKEVVKCCPHCGKELGQAGDCRDA